MILVLDDSALRDVRVLILEDEFLIAMDVEQLCRDSGASEVSLLRNLAEADALDIASFDVAIIDVMVGGRSSLDFAKRLRAEGMPFIFASGYGRVDGLFDGFPGVPVVGKPYAGGALVGAVAAVRENRGEA